MFAVSILKKWSFKSSLEIKWEIIDPNSFLDQCKAKPIPAIVEGVPNGNTVHAFMLPSFDYVKVKLDGIKVQNHLKVLKYLEYFSKHM